MKIPENAVVVGFDGSELSGAALQWGAAFAVREDLPLVVLNAAAAIIHAQDKGVGNFDADRASASAAAIAERGAEQIRAEHPELTVEIATSLSSASLALQEASVRARCVVLGNRGHGRVAGTLLGSTAFNVTEHARCPVVVVPRGDVQLPGPDSPIVVGVDGSHSSMKAVDSAGRVSRATGAPVKILVVWRKASKDPWGNPPSGYESVGDASDTMRTGAEAVVEKAKQRLLQKVPGTTVEAEVVSGRPDVVLGKASGDAGLLVVGARGRGDLASLLLGSTSRAVLHHAKCPVTIVR